MIYKKINLLLDIHNINNAVCFNIKFLKIYQL